MVVAAMVVAAPPVIQSIAASGDNVTITWTAVAGMVYQVEYKSDLAASTWNWGDWLTRQAKVSQARVNNLSLSAVTA